MPYPQLNRKKRQPPALHPSPGRGIGGKNHYMKKIVASLFSFSAAFLCSAMAVGAVVMALAATINGGSAPQIFILWLIAAIAWGTARSARTEVITNKTK